MVIQLADRSIRLARGIIVDILISVGEFSYPMDFFVIEIKKVSDVVSEVPIIVSWPLQFPH